jgi:hypothetical protein
MSKIKRRITWKSLLKFVDSVSLNVGVLGVGLRKPAEKKQARSIITFLESKRVLYQPFHREDIDYCSQSVLKIRDKIIEFCSEYDGVSTLRNGMKKVVKQCNVYLDVTGSKRFSHLPRPMQLHVFQKEILKLQSVAGKGIGNLALYYDISLDEELARIIPFNTKKS